MDDPSTPDLRALHARLGRVWHQPLPVASFTNKRATVNDRVPVEQVRRLLPKAVEVDEIDATGLGMVSMCACDFWVTRIGPVPMPRVHTNEMLCRISVRIRKRGRTNRAYYTLRSDSSSRFIGTLGGRFSHFRKRISHFTKREDGRTYELTCRADDEISGGRLSIDLSALSKQPPTTTIFPSVEAATDFVLQLDGSCGYDYDSDRLSLQIIGYPPWNTQFCHGYEFNFNLLDFLFAEFSLDAELDHVLFMENTPQTWGASFLYPPEQGARSLEPASVALTPASE